MEAAEVERCGGTEMILEREDRLTEVLAENPVTILHFGAESCGPCRAIREKILGWRREHPGVGYVYIDTADFPALCAQRGVFTVPVVEIWAEGRPFRRESGCFSLEELLRQAERYMAMLN